MCVMRESAPCHAEVVKIYRKPAEENYSSLAVSKDAEKENLQLRRFRRCLLEQGDVLSYYRVIYSYDVLIQLKMLIIITNQVYH